MDDMLYRCTVCGRVGTVGRCCGDETREPLNDLARREQEKIKAQNLPKANACPQLGEVRADIERLQCFTSNHALEENAYIRAIDDVIEIIDKKLASISTKRC